MNNHKWSGSYSSFIFRLQKWPQPHHSLIMKLNIELQTLKIFLLTLKKPQYHSLQNVTDYASSIGCPKQFFLVPLQSNAAHFMGPRACVKVHEGWSEPVILWGVVTHKGQKKSPALGCFHRELTKIEG